MEKIIRNGREFLRFKISDEFKMVSAGEKLTNLIKNNFASKEIDREKGFIYPVFNDSTGDRMIQGYANEFKSRNSLRITMRGANVGDVEYINYKYYNSTVNSLESELFCNHYTSLYLSKMLPNLSSGSTLKALPWKNYKDEYIEIPSNHEELSKIIKRVNEYKQLSKQLSKQMEDYKKAILQESEKSIKYFKESGQHDKYISFKIGDEFSAISGKGSFNKMKLEGLCSDEYNEELGFIYPFYDASTKNNHIKGYCKEYNIKGDNIKFSTAGNSIYRLRNNISEFDPTPAGTSKFITNYFYLGQDAVAINSNVYANNLSGLILNKKLPLTEQGTNGVHHVYWSNIQNSILELPNNHRELSKKIEQINKWQIQVNKTTKKMEKYIDGVLQMSLK